MCLVMLEALENLVRLTAPSAAPGHMTFSYLVFSSSPRLLSVRFPPQPNQAKLTRLFWPTGVEGLTGLGGDQGPAGPQGPSGGTGTPGSTGQPGEQTHSIQVLLTHQMQGACLRLHIIMLFQGWWETQVQMERTVLWVPTARLEPPEHWVILVGEAKQLTDLDLHLSQDLDLDLGLDLSLDLKLTLLAGCPGEKGSVGPSGQRGPDGKPGSGGPKGQKGQPSLPGPGRKGTLGEKVISQSLKE